MTCEHNTTEQKKWLVRHGFVYARFFITMFA